MNWPDPRTLTELTPHQQTELGKATARGNLAVLGGSPGTGKSFTAAALVRAIGKQIGYSSICVGSPTGKAAVRMTEAMAAYKLPLRAKTWHSALGVQEASHEGWTFEHHRGNPLDFRVLVGDEMSMCDVDLAKCIFAARAPGAKFLLIGDVNQLPPVGHGAPLRDLIRSGRVPYGELREILRNDGGIVQACADIRDGKPFQIDGNLRHAPARGDNATKDALIETINEAARRHGLNDVWDVQVLVAVNAKGELCRKKLNTLLQNVLNPNEPIDGTPFRLGDKVVNTKNGWLPLSERHKTQPGEVLQQDADGNVYVANGELGEAVQVDPKITHVKLSSPHRIVKVPRGAGDRPQDDEDEDDKSPNTGCNWDLGYALSCHKSQGSQWPVVVVVVDPSASARQVCTREWIYTAISRAEQSCYLVGPLDVAQGFARRTAIDTRKTFLAERLQAAISAF